MQEKNAVQRIKISKRLKMAVLERKTGLNSVENSDNTSLNAK